MSEYPLTMLNLIEYADVCLKKQSAEYGRIILNVSDAVHSIRSLCNLLSRCLDRHIQNTVKIFQMERFAKRIMPECRWTTRNFLGGGRRRGLWNQGTSINISSKKQSGSFFPQSGNLFLSSYVPVSVAEQASVSLNMPKCPCKWLNKLF